MDGDNVDNILVVDEHPGDIRFIEEAFRASALDPTIHTSTSSDEALQFLSDHGGDDGAVNLDVILLDWNLARTTGKEVLEAAKSVEEDIPVIVMTGSEAETSILESTIEKADLIIERPTKPDEYIDSVCSIRAGD